MLKTISHIWHAKDLRNQILFTLLIVICFRILAHISVPGIDLAVLKETFAQNGNILGAFSAFTGGSMENFSVILMGLSPYINASIIIQLMTVIFPHMEEWKHEGQEGQRKINKWTRRLTIPLAFLQSYGMILLMNNQAGGQLIDNVLDPATMLPMMLTVTAGTMLAVWLGELITEKGIGNGVSILIFTGIISGIPSILASQIAISKWSPEQTTPFIILGLITLALTVFVVLVTEAFRHIPITYANRRGGSAAKSSIPIRINQAGMIPIIFAVSMVTFPSIIAQFFKNSSNEMVANISNWFIANFSATQAPSWMYIGIFFSLTIFFTFFYTSITFQPEEIADNIQKRGGFIPGIRPGKNTAEYIGKVSNALNLWGGLFIGIVAILPMILNIAFANLGLGTVQLLISGAGIIIVVGVALELGRQLNARLAEHDYEKLY